MAAAIPSPGADQFPELVLPQGVGVNIHFTGDQRDLDLIAQGGFKMIRMDFGWQAVEREKGVYNFDRSGYDALTQGCLKRGIRPLYILDYSNRLYEKGRAVETEEGRKAYAEFAAAAAKHYAGKGIIWEIWNEPNIKQFWEPQPSFESYSKLVEAAAPRIREADAKALVVAGATSTIPFQWLEECFQRGMLKHVDGVTVHPYRPKAPETALEDYSKLRELVRKYAPEGKYIPILSGEWGYSNVNWDKARLTDEQQAQYLVREFLINLYAHVPVSIWYDWKNDGTNPDDREHQFGTMTHDLQPKAAYKAAKVLTQTLSDYAITERVDTGNEKDFVFRMKKGRNEAIAFWAMEGERKIGVEAQGGHGTVVDYLGGAEPLKWEGNRVELDLSPSPKYLVIER
jgi:hypothetical protein